MSGRWSEVVALSAASLLPSAAVYPRLRCSSGINVLAFKNIALTLYIWFGRDIFRALYQHQSHFVRNELKQLVIDVLREEQHRQNCAVLTYCLMPDHLHFLTSPQLDGASVLKFTDQFKGKATNRSWMLGWRGKLWQARFFDHIVRAEEDLLAISEYILNNPVRRGSGRVPGGLAMGRVHESVAICNALRRLRAASGLSER